MTVRVGLVGAGNISDTHARALRAMPNVEIAAIYAPTRDHADALAARHGAAAAASLDALLAHRPLDMVVIGTPSALHAEHGIAAAARGLHVLVEKPIDTDVARADALIEAAARAGVTLGVIFQDRLKPDVQRLKALVDGGRLGTPILASARVKWYRPPSYYRDSRWRGTQALDGGGALMNQGVHTVDLLLWLFGPVRRVFGKTMAGLHAIEVEDTAVAVLEFANGAIGTLEAATSAYPGYSRQIELTGSNGTVRLEGDDLAAVDLKDARDDERPASRHGATASAASPVVADAAAHVRVFEDFLRAVATRSAPCCDGPGGRRSVALINAIYDSARTNLPATIP
ncbi:MAG TPA: Gfo/Idh/MocA family oxidoreductase [Vicinamibacterales bacterium]|jgi:predicted dehydrogenase|nr:Gfo/Idh/MocA family oxidoreductase [Vicinamibacterales bacterium]